ncbi:TIGR03619 family F420-dependent LLM class oxidoreductase [Yinghuangia sp. YIM S09857]|uniref:TIGR03619 family F420-dependent LLM class oxidoreductase n=1 Tax=Yinghuangia sp. YIM S09857 TaxID=3436929 RepID=UPI003F52F9A2
MSHQPTRPQLSMSLTTFAAEDPGNWDALFEHARLLDRVVVSDHIAYGDDIEAYGRPETGGIAGGKQPTGPDGHWLEPLTVLTALSTVTTRVRLGTNILQAALRRPVVLAKTASTLDVLSRGRLDLGVGVGWQREEYEAAGLPFDGRGRLLDHTLEVLRTLWREQRASYDGHGLTFENIHQMPKPTQPGGVPLWISGTVNRNVARRLARFGDGWIPWGPAAADIADGIARMREAVAAEGRDTWDIQVVGTLRTALDDSGRPDIKATLETVPAMIEAGVTDVRVTWPLVADPNAAEESLSALVQAFHATTR